MLLDIKFTTNGHIMKLLLNFLLNIINLNSFKHDIDSGLYFKSNIPIASGLGSSGALVSSIINKFTSELGFFNKSDFDLKSCEFGSAFGLIFGRNMV